MRTKVKKESSELALMRVLDAFVQELVDVSDEEILDAAQALGMDPSVRESAAYAGVIYPSRWQLSDFFDLDPRKALQTTAGQIAGDPPTEQQDKSRRSKRPRISVERKTPGRK